MSFYSLDLRTTIANLIWQKLRIFDSKIIGSDGIRVTCLILVQLNSKLYILDGPERPGWFSGSAAGSKGPGLNSPVAGQI